MVRRLGPEHVAIVHDGGSKVPWHIYSPLRYEFGRGLRQYIYHHGEGNQIQVEPYPMTESRETQSLATLPVDHVLVIRSEFQGAADIARQLRRGIEPLGDGPVVRGLLGSSSWKRVEARTWLAFIKANTSFFRREDALGGPPSDEAPSR